MVDSRVLAYAGLRNENAKKLTSLVNKHCIPSTKTSSEFTSVGRVLSSIKNREVSYHDTPLAGVPWVVYEHTEKLS